MAETNVLQTNNLQELQEPKNHPQVTMLQEAISQTYVAHHYGLNGSQAASNPTEYILGSGSLENLRLELQNGIGPWGKSHQEAIQTLQEHLTSTPKIITHIGAGPDLSLVLIDRERYPDAHINVIESDPQKVAHINQRLERLGLQNSVTVHQGDAAQVLPELSKQGHQSDVIVAQLLFQHLNREQLERIMAACEDNLPEGGILLASDLILEHWGVTVDVDHLHDPNLHLATHQVNTYINGDFATGQKGVKHFGWTARGAHYWQSHDHFTSTLQSASNLYEAHRQTDAETTFTHDSGIVAKTITKAIQPTIALGISATIQRLIKNGANPQALIQLTLAEKFMWEQGENYATRLLSIPGLKHRLPTMTHTFLQKIPTSHDLPVYDPTRYD